jgi:hypothetical protein
MLDLPGLAALDLDWLVALDLLGLAAASTPTAEEAEQAGVSLRTNGDQGDSQCETQELTTHS